jgi:hypothetical protein
MRTVLKRLGVARSELLQQSEASLRLFDLVVDGDIVGVRRSLIEAEQAHHDHAQSTLRKDRTSESPLQCVAVLRLIVDPFMFDDSWCNCWTFITRY